MTRNKVLSDAANKCMKELYSFAQPSVSWEYFVEENKIYSEQYKQWENFHKAYFDREKYPNEWEEQKKIHPEWEEKNRKECIGPAPYEFYYLPKDIMKDICDSYVYAYKMDEQQNLLDIIQILKDYCKNPIIDKYVEGENGNPGYKGYDHPDNLLKEINNILDDDDISELIQNKFFKFLDMAGSFYNWNRDLSSFNMTVYLGASPNSNKQAVIDNWKKYRNQDIEIDESKYKDDDDYTE